MRLSLFALFALLAIPVAAKADLYPGSYAVYDFSGTILGNYGFGSGFTTIPGTNNVVRFGASLSPTTVNLNFGPIFANTAGSSPALTGIEFIGNRVADHITSISLEPASTLLGVQASSHISTIGPYQYTYIDFDLTKSNLQPNESATFDLNFASSQTPEPGSILLLATGLCVLGGATGLRRIA